MHENYSRRDFVTALAVVPLAAKWLPPRTGRHRYAGDYGLQLYSLRHELQKDVPGTLKTIAADGYKEVETAGLYGVQPEQFRRYLDDAGLKATSMHAMRDDLLRDHMDEVIGEAKALGVDYVVCSYIGEERRKTLDGYKQVAAEFNGWARKLRDAGYHFAFHNHDYEFKPMEGSNGLDTLLQNTDANLVDFEMDVFWVKRGGKDPVDYMKRYPKRFGLMHLKDMRKGTPQGDFSVGTSDEATVPLGTGILDIPAILREAELIAIKHYYVEDESAEAPEGIKKSLAYLKTVRF